MRYEAYLLLVVASISCLSGCHSPLHRDQGALLGGLTGAGIGAAIGEHNDDPLAGAAIGAAVGALAGGALGDNVDAQVERNNAIIEQRLGQRLAGAVTTGQVVMMSRAGLSEEVIIAHIQANGVRQRPTANDLIELKSQGVSDRVINAMQNQTGLAVAAPGPRPVVVREHHYWAGPDCYYGPHWRFHRHHPRLHWGFAFGH